jgi:hypothetical protein
VYGVWQKAAAVWHSHPVGAKETKGLARRHPRLERALPTRSAMSGWKEANPEQRRFTALSDCDLRVHCFESTPDDNRGFFTAYDKG